MTLEKQQDLLESLADFWTDERPSWYHLRTRDRFLTDVRAVVEDVVMALGEESLPDRISRLNPQPDETFLLRAPYRQCAVSRDGQPAVSWSQGFIDWWREMYPTANLVILTGENTLECLTDAQLKAAGFQRIPSDSATVGVD